MRYLKNTIVTIFFITVVFSCKNKSVDNQSIQKPDLKSDFVIDSTGKDIGVLRIFQLIDSINLYKEKNESSLFGAVKLDYTLPLLHFYPELLSRCFDPLYFKYEGNYNDLLDGIGYVRDLTFRVLDKDDNWFKIVFNEEQYLTCYIKNVALLGAHVKERYLSDHGFRTWNEYFRGEYLAVRDSDNNIVGEIVDGIDPIILNDSLLLYDKLEGVALSADKKPNTFGFYCDTIVGDWMKIKVSFTDVSYWIKWRNGRKLMINYYETWGLE